MTEKMNPQQRKRQKALRKQLQRLEKLENKELEKKKRNIARVETVKEKVREKVPEKLKTTLTAAFYKGFETVFEKGTAAIEKTYDKERLEAMYRMNQDMTDYGNRPEKALKEMEKDIRRTHTAGKGMAAAEGTVLGLFGIGLPDIPLFLAVLLKGVYETALRYGFSYDSREEKIYVLNLICAALSEGEEKRKYSLYLDLQGDEMDLQRALASGDFSHFSSEDPMEYKEIQKEAGEKTEELRKPDSGWSYILEDLPEDGRGQEETEEALSEQDREVLYQEALERASETLSAAMLTAKFVQGIPLVGAVGSVANLSVYARIADFAGIKYQKRFLRKKMLGPGI